jgi:two-component system sensor histidine kinase/response regulator
MTDILVIEDDPLNQEAIVATLQHAGYQVTLAPNGALGVEMARSDHPDLIICDVTMPWMDGHEVLRLLRNDSETANIPFIFLTARTEYAALRQGMDLGADDYLTKPFVARELLQAVRARLERRDAIDQEYKQRIGKLEGAVIHTLPQEIIAPLNTILGYSDLIVSDADDMPKAQIVDLVEQINASSTKLFRLVENIVIYARIELRKKDADILKADVRREFKTEVSQDFIGAVVDRVAAHYHRQDDVQLDIPQSMPFPIFRDDLAKIVRELADNAFKFSEPGTPVKVAARSRPGHCVLSVRNEGRGMTPGQIAQIGEYVQFERRLQAGQGLGLGLAIVKGLLEIYGGELAITSIPNQHTIAQVILME